uniref:Uncharacterized protein n=3 Tax=Phaeomonas parva TaxID=124430 RepID=A0A7S1TZF0_9STRA|mmetsp:Transcript_23919/g.75360  ORF Transcript_23919/g.75360 Transcript_23919/m.75360 type:complete len:113 (+) Transcript_23919:237-575(+)
MAEAQPPALRRPLKTVRTLLLSPPEALDLRAQTLTLSAAAQRRGLKEIARACADEAWEPRVDAERWDVTPALNAVCRAQMLRLVKASIDVVDDFLVSRESQLWRDTVASYKG